MLMMFCAQLKTGSAVSYSLLYRQAGQCPTTTQREKRYPFSINALFFKNSMPSQPARLSNASVGIPPWTKMYLPVSKITGSPCKNAISPAKCLQRRRRYSSAFSSVSFETGIPSSASMSRTRPQPHSSQSQRTSFKNRRPAPSPESARRRSRPASTLPRDMYTSPSCASSRQ